MLICDPALKPYMNVYLPEFDNIYDINEFKSTKRGFKKENYESKSLRSCKIQCVALKNIVHGHVLCFS